MFLLMGSTYIEPILSHTKHTKIKMRRKILDEHLEDTVFVVPLVVSN